MAESYLRDILSFYGDNSSLSTTNLENFLNLITSRRAPAPIDSETNPLRNAECLSAPDLLDVFGLSNVSELTVDQLDLICPAVLNQILLPSCPYVTPSTITIAPQVWGYSFLAVTIINLSSLLGLLLVPLTKKSYFPKVLTYFIGVAIGTLFSNAALQLIPEALGFDPKVDNYVANAIGIFAGFYILYFTEGVLKIALKVDLEHCHDHFPEVQTNDVSIISYSNDIIINNKTSDIIANNANHEVLSNSLSEKPSQLTVNPVNEQESCTLVGCRWLRGEPVSNIKTVAWMITLSDGLHNFIDGLAIGASFTVSLLTGFSTSIAILCEEFPHELGDFVILLNSGMSVPQAVFFNMLSATSCYLGLVLGILLGSNFAPNAIFAIAGGMFLYIALADMSGVLKDMEEFHIRRFEDTDHEDVKDIFTLGMSEHVPSSCMHVLKQPLTQMLLTCVFCALMASSKSILLPILAVTLLLAAGRQGIIYMFSRYIQVSLQKDLNSIRETYLKAPNSCFWVAECQGQVVGTVACLPAEKNKGCLELKRLSVKHSHRRKGIAKALCRTLADFAQQRGFPAVVLYTSVVQTEAHKLYENMGFKKVREFVVPEFIAKITNFTLFEYKLDLQQPEN
ncbi:Zinc transporter ZIP8 [Bagarius yarrelli]|uniref:Zinc transporter ZIP8 n=1 Tax=Bagarius yarrelli TaxID=175774 RepID=A0A556TRE0_BAGYA|nr:Zinc transporter ZIP8 [Bagarius yarrelli]